jgi:hypothetical protein
MAQAMLRLQERPCLDLLAKVRAGIRNGPVLVIAGDSDRALRSRTRCGIPGAGAAAGSIVGVPLRKPATGRGAKNDNTQQTLLPLSFGIACCANALPDRHDVITRGQEEDNNRDKRNWPNGRGRGMM